MAGGNPGKGSSNRPSASSSASHHRKSNRESGPNNTESAPSKPSPSKPQSNTKPSPSSRHKPSPLNPNPIHSPHPRPENFAPPPLPPPPPAYGFHMLDRRTIVLADGSVRSYFALPPDYQDFAPPLPRPPMRPHGADPWKYGDERDLREGGEVNDEFASAFLNFIRLINENSNQKKKYLADGKQGSLRC
ncbi:hypothetical protein L1887_16284 [Cichorium endivia]|nr:hypothetical protein L1887_16284 [Cichorium endivia]